MKAIIGQCLNLLGILQKIDPEFPLQYAVCLMEIAQDEGMSLTALADRTGMPLSTISRIVGALSGNRQRGQAYGLIDVTVSPAERRRKALTLTARGRAVVTDLERTLMSPPAYQMARTTSNMKKII